MSSLASRWEDSTAEQSQETEDSGQETEDCGLWHTSCTGAQLTYIVVMPDMFETNFM